MARIMFDKNLDFIYLCNSYVWWFTLSELIVQFGLISTLCIVAIIVDHELNAQNLVNIFPPVLCPR